MYLLLEFIEHPFKIDRAALLFDDITIEQTHDVSEGRRRTAIAVRRGLFKLQPGFPASRCTTITIRNIVIHIYAEMLFMTNRQHLSKIHLSY